MKKSQLNLGILALTAALTLQSCNDRLDIKPTQTIDPATALSTSKGVETALIGAYDGLQDSDLNGGNNIMLSDLYADDGEIQWVGTFADPNEVFRKKILKDNGYVSGMWLASYNVINSVNNVLSALDKVDAAKKDKVEGEARFIRGLVYFELVKNFGKTWGDGDNAANPAVPLVLTPTRGISDVDYRPRASVAQIYQQVLDDLTKAETLLTTAKGPLTAKGGATAEATAAILSRVYLMQKNYPAARDAANRVIISKKFALMQYVEDNFNQGTVTVPEHVYSSLVTDQDGTNALWTHYSVDGRGGDIEILRKHLLLYEATDDRLNQLFYVDGGVVYTAKHDTRYNNVVLVRLAEMYLTRAEANFRASTTVGATPLADVNLIRQRSALAPLTSTTLTLAAILKERKLELAFEGQNLHDLKRTGRAIGSRPFNDNALLYPIPQRETDANTALTQNPGY